MAVYFPGSGTGAERTSDVAIVGPAIVFMPKVVGVWWRPLVPEPGETRDSQTQSRWPSGKDRGLHG